MKFHQHRCYWSTDKKVDGMYRILLLGDSVLLGQGVPYFDSLSSKLETFLNQQIWHLDIETINLGQSGFSIYDEWLEYLRWGHTTSADMVIITIGAHDVGLFRIPGDHEIVDYWENNSVHLSYFDAVLKDISNYVKKYNLPLIIAFYDVFEYEHKSALWEDIKRRAEKYNLHCVQLIPCEKTDQFADIMLHVSKADPHPSIQATDRSAGVLCQYIITNEILPAPEAGLQISYIDMLDNAIALHKNSVKMEYVLYRLKNVLSSKQSIKKLIPYESMALLEDKVNILFTRTVAVLFLEAYAAILASESQKIESLLFETDLALGRISKHMFVFEKSLEDDKLRCPLYQSVKLKKVNIKIYEKILSALRKWRTDFHETHNRFFCPFDLSHPDFMEFIDELSHRTRMASEIIVRHWKIATSLINNLEDIIQSFMDLFSRYQSILNDEELAKSFLGIAGELLTVFEKMETIIHLMNIHKMHSLKCFDVIDQPICNCIVHLKSNSKKAHIRVRLDTVVPYYPTIIEAQWIINDGTLHAYPFQFPLFTLGTLRIQLFGEGDIEFECIKLYLNEDRQITMRKEDFILINDSVYDSGQIFTTL